MHKILKNSLSICLGMTFFLIILWIIMIVIYVSFGTTIFPVKAQRIRSIIKMKKLLEEEKNENLNEKN